MKFKKKTAKKEKVSPKKDQIFKWEIVINKQSLGFMLAVLGLFLSSLGFLLGSPQAINQLETAVFQSSTVSSPKLPPVLTQDVKVAQTPTFEIVDGKIAQPSLESVAILAKDFDSEQVLYQKNTQTRLFPASTTKIMTALVALEHYKSNDILTVPQQAMVGGSTMGLKAGEKLTFRSLLYGMLLNSGNDAAYTIAINYPGGMNNFVLKMNEKAGSLGLLDTHFENPAGFDDSNHYSSASDLAVIAKEAMKNEQFARVVGTKETTVVSLGETIETSSSSAEVNKSQRTHILKNLNQLLSEPGVIGIKTGTTDKAGENLIALVEKDGHRVLTVVLGSTKRFEESKILVDWVFRNYSWKLSSK